MGTSTFTWRDLLSVIKHLPPDSALGRARDPLGRDYQIVLAELTFDALNRLIAYHGNQTKAREGQMPKRVGEVMDAEMKRQIAARRVVGKSIRQQMDEINKRLGWG